MEDNEPIIKNPEKLIFATIVHQKIAMSLVADILKIIFPFLRKGKTSLQISKSRDKTRIQIIMSRITPFIYLGDGNDAQNASFLKTNDIRLIVNCAQEIPNFYNKYIRYIHLDWSDHPEQKIFPTVTEVTDDILNEVVNKRKVFIHCAAGISRSATVVIYTIMRQHKWDYNKSALFVRNFRNIINPNPGFVKQLQDAEYNIFGIRNDDVDEEPVVPVSTGIISRGVQDMKTEGKKFSLELDSDQGPQEKSLPVVTSTVKATMTLDDTGPGRDYAKYGKRKIYAVNLS